MIDPLLTLQSDITDKLNSESYFSDLSVKSLRAMVIAKEIEKLVPWLTLKGGKKGCGVLVGMPTIQAVDPNLSVPNDEVLIPLDTVEQPEINFNPGGTMKTAEEVSRAVRRYLHHFSIFGKIFIYSDKEAVTPLVGIEKTYPGCVGYRTLMRGRMVDDSLLKVPGVALSELALTVTLTNALAGATIYYTTDLSFPGAGNSAAILYTVPFFVASGTVVRSAAYKNGYDGSDANFDTIT